MTASSPATATMTRVCATVISEGGYFEIPSLAFDGGREIANAISTVSEVPLVAIRPALTFNSLPNRIMVQLAGLDIFATGSMRWRAWYFPPGSANPVTGGSWTAAAAGSGVEINVSGTGFSSTGGYGFQGGYVGVAVAGNARSNISQNILQAAPLTIDMAGAGDPRSSNVGANPAYIVFTALGAGSAAAAWPYWREIR